MNRSIWIVLLLLVLPLGCARLPQILPANLPLEAIPPECACDRIFPEGEWQLLHAMEATAPGGRKQTILGLSQISSKKRAIHCVVMTLEGMVLFEADYDGTIDVRRAVPPFDKPGIAEGIIEDLRLIFFSPGRPEIETGTLTKHERVCRYLLPGGDAEDIEIDSDRGWTIHKYNRRNRVVRTVRAESAPDESAHGMPERITLEAPGLTGYRLNLSLIEANPMTNQTKR